MNSKRVLLAAALIVASCGQSRKNDNNDGSVSAPTTADSTVPGPVPNTTMTEAYVRHMATSIYLWAWPMMNIHNRVAMFRSLPGAVYGEGVLPLAPPNHLCMLTDYVKPEEKDVACPNQDVVYGFGSLDLTKEPVVVQIPDFGNRFWVYQVCDQRTDGFASFGKMYGTKPGFYLLAGNAWNGQLPDGINAVYKCPTALGVVIPRTFQADDPTDKKAVQQPVSQITMYPLSAFDGKMKTTDWTKTPSTPPVNRVNGGETKWVVPEKFFDELPVVIQEVPPMAGEEAWYAQVRNFMDAIEKNPKLKEAAKLAAIDAEQNLITPLFQLENVGYPLKYNWSTISNGARFGTDYLTRTACAKANIFVNKPNETKYFYQDMDSAGTQLDGSNKYTVTFAKGETPPTKGFWSLTLYNPQHFFAPNSLGRYSLGTKNKDLKQNADGSLTIYVQSTPPDAAKMNNWLPAPKGGFCLYVRCYWPDEAALKDRWTPPAVVRTK